MRPKSLILLALALGCGLVASIGISQVLEARRHKSSGDEQTDVLVALADIERNSEFNDKNVAIKPWPKSQVPPGAITSLEKVAGKRPSTRIFNGEVILEGKVGTGEGATRASREIPPGYGTVPVRMDNAQNNGLILPGDRVDVQVFINKGPNAPSATTLTFLRDISVFAVNSEIRQVEGQEAKMDAKTVTLLVTPQQAAKLTLASEVGTIRLFLRGEKSDTSSDDVKADMDSLMGKSDSGANTTGSGAPTAPALGGIDDFLRNQLAVKTLDPAPDKRKHQMVIVHGHEAHVEVLTEGDPLPRKLTPDGQPVAPDAAPAPAPGPPATVTQSDDGPTNTPATGGTTPVSSPIAPGGATLHRPAPNH